MIHITSFRRRDYIDFSASYKLIIKLSCTEKISDEKNKYGIEAYDNILLDFAYFNKDNIPCGFSISILKPKDSKENNILPPLVWCLSITTGTNLKLDEKKNVIIGSSLCFSENIKEFEIKNIKKIIKDNINSDDVNTVLSHIFDEKNEIDLKVIENLTKVITVETTIELNEISKEGTISVPGLTFVQKEPNIEELLKNEQLSTSQYIFHDNILYYYDFNKKNLNKLSFTNTGLADFINHFNKEGKYYYLTDENLEIIEQCIIDLKVNEKDKILKKTDLSLLEKKKQQFCALVKQYESDKKNGKIDIASLFNINEEIIVNNKRKNELERFIISASSRNVKMEEIIQQYEELENINNKVNGYKEKINVCNISFMDDENKSNSDMNHLYLYKIENKVCYFIKDKKIDIDQENLDFFNVNDPSTEQLKTIYQIVEAANKLGHTNLTSTQEINKRADEKYPSNQKENTRKRILNLSIGTISLLLTLGLVFTIIFAPLGVLFTALGIAAAGVTGLITLAFAIKTIFDEKKINKDLNNKYNFKQNLREKLKIEEKIDKFNKELIKKEPSIEDLKNTISENKESIINYSNEKKQLEEKLNLLQNKKEILDKRVDEKWKLPNASEKLFEKACKPLLNQEFEDKPCAFLIKSASELKDIESQVSCYIYIPAKENIQAELHYYNALTKDLVCIKGQNDKDWHEKFIHEFPGLKENEIIDIEKLSQTQLSNINKKTDHLHCDTLIKAFEDNLAKELKPKENFIIEPSNKSENSEEFKELDNLMPKIEEYKKNGDHIHLHKSSLKELGNAPIEQSHQKYISRTEFENK